MSLANLFRRGVPQQSSSRVGNLLTATVQYLRSRPTDEEFVPAIVAAAIGESEVAAFTALSLLAEEGVTRQHFGVYCNRLDVPLETLDNLSQLRDEFDCDECDERHSIAGGGCRVEVFFTVDASRLSKWGERASAA